MSGADSKPCPYFDRVRGEPVAVPTHEEFVSAHDGAKLFVQYWLPRGEPGAVVYMLHGLSGHGRQFALLADGICPEGYALVCPDYRGHGLSGGRRGDIPSLEALMKDLDRVLEWVRDRFPGRPIFLAGESMGGAVAVNYIIDRQDAFKGLILSVPAIKAFIQLDPVKTALMPVFLLLLALWPGARVISTKGNEDRGSRNPLAVEAERHDQLKLPFLSPRYFWQVRRLMLSGLNRGAGATRVPTLIFAGGKDVVVNTDGAREYFDRLAAEDKELVVYPHGFHGLLCDEEYGPLMKQHTAQWLHAHT